MKLLAVMRKTLRELMRERMTVGLMLVFPIFMVGFYYVSFGQTDEGLAKHLSVLILNRDEGGPDSEGVMWYAGQAFVDVLRSAEFEGQPLFAVTEINERRRAETTLREHKASLLVEIPLDFSTVLQTFVQGDGSASPADITLIGAPESGDYVFARSLLSGYLRHFALQMVGWDESVEIRYRFVSGTGTMSDFDFGVGGVIVFGITFSTIIAAEVMVREQVGGTLRRLRLTRLNAFILLSGVTLALLLVSLVQIPITLGAALAMGFHNNGSLWAVILVSLVFSLSAIGLGLVVACFSRTPADATNLASAVMVPLVFLSDALYPMPEVPIFTWGGRIVQIYDILPTTHAAEAIRQVTIFGKGLGQLTYELVALVILSIFLYALGVAVYHRRRLRLG